MLIYQVHTVEGNIESLVLLASIPGGLDGDAEALITDYGDAIADATAVSEDDGSVTLEYTVVGKAYKYRAIVPPIPAEDDELV